MYFNVNFNVFFKLIKVHLLVNELYMLKKISAPKQYEVNNLQYYIRALYGLYNRSAATVIVLRWYNVCLDGGV